MISLIRRRLAADPRMIAFAAFGLVALLVLLPMTVVRAVQGNIPQAFLNAVITAGIVLVIFRALRGGNLDRLGAGASVVVVAGTCATIFMNPAGIFWAFPAMLTATFLARPLLGLLLAAALTGVLFLEGDSLAATGQPIAVILALTANALFGALFAQRTRLRHKELEVIASVDALTGAQNRRALEAELKIVASGFRRDGRAVSLVLIDLDHFKQVNDQFGHDAGDRVLQHFVELAQQSVRSTDRLFRFGGEEFVLLMPNTDALGIELSMSHLRAKLRDSLNVSDRNITVSMGGAVLHHGESPEAWLARADASLYRAKHAGRNRLEIDAGDL